MDKVKVILAVLKKHHFWVMSVVALLVGVSGWFVATGKLWAEYKTNRGKVEGEFGELKKISSDPKIRNQNWIAAMEQETQLLKTKVRMAWQQMHAMQRDNVLKWPESLSKEFRDKISSLGPTEEIPYDQLSEYWNYIQNEFPLLLHIVEAENLQQEPPTDPNAEVESQPDYKVTWDAQSQKELHDRLSWEVIPTSYDVRRAQEDLWVYQALLRIIAKLNENAKGQYDAKIKEIKDLSIADFAVEKYQSNLAEGRLEHPALAPGATAAQIQLSQPPMNPRAADASGQAASPDAGRYVDAKGMQLDPATAPVEFKRMPVYLRITMDQREVARLLVECANSPLPIEVRQLRIRSDAEAGPQAPRGSSFPSRMPSGGMPSRSMPPRGMGPPGGGRGMEMLRGSGRSMPSGPAPRNMGPTRTGSSPTEGEKSPFDVEVELYGIIYIFNPPDQSKFGDSAATDASAPAPASTKPPAVAPPIEQPPAAPAPAAQPTNDQPAAKGEESGDDVPSEDPVGDEPVDEPATDPTEAEVDGA